MVKGISKFIKIIHFLGDMILLNFSFIVAYIFKVQLNPLKYFNDHYIFLHIAFNLIWLLIVLLLKLYNIERVSKIEHILLNLFKSVLIHAFFIFGFIVSIKGYYYSRGHLLFSYLIFAFLVLFWRFIFMYILKVLRSLGANFKQVIIVGAGAAGNQIYNYFKTDVASGYKFMGFFDDHADTCVHKELVIGSVSDVKVFASKNKVDEIFCALPLTATKKIRELMTFADNNFIRIRIVPDFRGFLNKKVNMDFYNRVPVLTVRSEPLENLFNRFIKRLFDVIFSLLVICIIYPILFPVFIIILKLTSPGPVFFVQKRSGRKNEEFYCYKFRTMTVNENADTMQATKADPRITKIGRFLRKSNLDELPQFFNVLIGNMSVVGPRPHMLRHTEEYSKIIDKFMVRHLVKPGITGWAQVNGFRGTTSNPKWMIKRVRYDMWYIENWSFLLDIKIIFLTVFNMVKGEKNAG
ncbi:MAG TPA: undecaprenyl-phosphate glucose phosphotransferase [Cytophagaceae bacterium]|jgi:Undecaprenyl-phosphate glucose phosphotransferase